MKQPRLCSLEDCDKVHYGKDLCRRHYLAQWENTRLCSIEGCGDGHEALGLCSSHYMVEWEKNNKAHRQEYSQGRYEQNKEKVREYNQQYYQNNKDYFKQKYSEWAKSHPEERRVLNRKRRALLSGVESEPYTQSQVVEAYGTLCHLCLVEIDFSAPRRQGLAPGWELGLHIDHVVALAKGGPDILANVRPSHAVCNLLKKDKDL